MRCEKHKKDYEWIQLTLTKSVHRCPDCHAGVVAERPEQKFPRVKYQQNWHRTRELTDKEKKAPFQVRRPKF